MSSIDTQSNTHDHFNEQYMTAERGQTYVMRPWLKPYEHQLTAFRDTKDSPYWAHIWDMRTGKTKIIYDTFGHLWMRGEVDCLFVIAPKGAYHAWIEQYHDRYNDKDELEYGHLNIDPVYVYSWIDASRAMLRSIGVFADPSKPKVDVPAVFIMNVEAFAMSQKAMKLAEVIVRKYRCMLVVDESHRIKNPKAVQTKNIQAIGGRAPYRRILTGTPSANNLLDLYSQYGFLHSKIIDSPNYYAFRARYAVMKDIQVSSRTIKSVVGFRRTDELHAKTSRFSTRIMKDQVFDMPPRIYEKRFFELNKETQRVYDEMRLQSIADLGHQTFVSAPLALTKLLRLEQIASGFVGVDEDGEQFKRALPDTRIDAIMDYMEQSSDEKVIIWCAFRYCVHRLVHVLSERYGKGSAVSFMGGISEKERKEAMSEFKNPRSGVRFFVGTAATGGVGLDLRPATLVAYHSNTFSLTDRLQSEDRPQHPLNKYSIGYVDFIARNTTNERIVTALRKKKNIADEVTGDLWREWL